jgi:hypothetical protein
MSIRSCPEGMHLIDNVAEALRRQCELPARTATPHEIALEMDIAEALKAANRHATDHLSHCPMCRTG